jgi:hypothetical protein
MTNKRSVFQTEYNVGPGSDDWQSSAALELLWDEHRESERGFNMIVRLQLESILARTH